ncbi:ATP synthase subunit I [Woeseia oceani]|uniref:F0F1 ATP synthase subunit I n=1 Tax=Woeseia oceani TaxID=1548547 RepID=A0A193LBJ1_9GAMM|nr:ATP synthase subunit I [Woeseia oceani]ANO49833.1 hypothetical protein BA177_00130 [Woeseia oceani]
MTVKAGEQTKGSAAHPLIRLLLLQLGLCVALAVLFWGTKGRVAGYSALLGGLTCAIPNAWLAMRLVAPRRDPGARALLNAAYIGETGKLALTLTMFALIFALVRPIAALPLFTTFIVCQLATLAGLLMRGQEPHRDTDTTNGE